MEKFSWVSFPQVSFLCPFYQLLLVDNTYHWIYLPTAKSHPKSIALKVNLKQKINTPEKLKNIAIQGKKNALKYKYSQKYFQPLRKQYRAFYLFFF